MKTKEQVNEVKRAWYAKNKDKARISARKSWAKHKEKRIAEHKVWVEKNKEYSKQYHKQYQKQWYLKNKEKRSAQIKLYSKAHPAENVIRVQRYAKKHPQKVKDYNDKFNKTLVGKYRYTIYRAKRWDSLIISLEEFTKIISTPCVYCGENEKNRGIDRIDNTKGYTKENSASCCKICNYMKKTMSVSDFLSHISKIYQLYKIK